MLPWQRMPAALASETIEGWRRPLSIDQAVFAYQHLVYVLDDKPPSIRNIAADWNWKKGRVERLIELKRRIADHHPHVVEVHELVVAYLRVHPGGHQGECERDPDPLEHSGKASANRGSGSGVRCRAASLRDSMGRAAHEVLPMRRSIRSRRPGTGRFSP